MVCHLLAIGPRQVRSHQKVCGHHGLARAQGLLIELLGLNALRGDILRHAVVAHGHGGVAREDGRGLGLVRRRRGRDGGLRGRGGLAGGLEAGEVLVAGGGGGRPADGRAGVALGLVVGVVPRAVGRHAEAHAEQRLEPAPAAGHGHVEHVGLAQGVHGLARLGELRQVDLHLAQLLELVGLLAAQQLDVVHLGREGHRVEGVHGGEVMRGAQLDALGHQARPHLHHLVHARHAAAAVHVAALGALHLARGAPQLHRAHLHAAAALGREADGHHVHLHQHVQPAAPIAAPAPARHRRRRKRRRRRSRNTKPSSVARTKRAARAGAVRRRSGGEGKGSTWLATGRHSMRLPVRRSGWRSASLSTTGACARGCAHRDERPALGRPTAHRGADAPRGSQHGAQRARA
mmetsp:Transcript_13777/g.50162  ORF Transcript_13777/g.50162 Transcript_13777/m.50162 type:complete len:404 (+) Transcript_13777:954-2165(+)